MRTKTTFCQGEAVIDAPLKLVHYPELCDKTVAEISGAWGLSCGFDLYNCAPNIIRDESRIRSFVYELCDLIGMKRFGECVVVNFGADERVAGFSMTQLIETSLISAHFANESNATYLDVFSCKAYDPEVVEKFAMCFFRASECKKHINLRR